MRQFLRLFREEEGMESVEYAVVAGILVGGTVLAISAIATWVQNRFSTLQTDLGA
jgi:Flp pilus assembly pilin Flp